MSDDLDDLIRRAMKTLDDQVPAGYFENRLHQETLARLEDSSMDTGTPGNDRSTSAAASTGAPPRGDAERDEDSGLHDIRSMASSTKMRLARKSTQNPVIAEDILASSSAGWKAVALPEPAKMVSLPELAELPSSRDLKEQAKVAEAAERAAAAAEKAAAKKAAGAAEKAASKAAATAVEVPVTAKTEAAVAAPVTPIIGARLAANKAPSSGGSKTGVFVVVGLGLAAAAGGVFYLSTQRSASKEPSIAMQAPAAAPEPASVPTVEPIEPPAVAEVATGSAEVAAAVDTTTVAIATDTDRKDDEGGRAKSPAKPKGKRAATDKNDDKPEVKAAPEPKKDKDGKEVKVDGQPSFDELLKEAGVTGKKEVKPKLDKKKLTGGDFKKGMDSISGKALGCYAGTQGTASIRLTIDPSGKVEKVKVSGVFAGTPVANCVQAAVKSATFPPWDGGPQTFGYSFLLSE